MKIGTFRLDLSAPAAMLQLLQPTLKTCLLKKAWMGVACVCLREGKGVAGECMKGPSGYLLVKRKESCTLSRYVQEKSTECPAFLSKNLHF